MPLIELKHHQAARSVDPEMLDFLTMARVWTPGDQPALQLARGSCPRESAWPPHTCSRRLEVAAAPLCGCSREPVVENRLLLWRPVASWRCREFACAPQSGALISVPNVQEKQRARVHSGFEGGYADKSQATKTQFPLDKELSNIGAEDLR